MKLTAATILSGFLFVPVCCCFIASSLWAHMDDFSTSNSLPVTQGCCGSGATEPEAPSPANTCGGSCLGAQFAIPDSKTTFYASSLFDGEKAFMRELADGEAFNPFNKTSVQSFHYRRPPTKSGRQIVLREHKLLI